MNFMNKLEQKYGRYAIPHLIRPIVFLYAVGYAIMSMAPSIYYQMLCLDFGKIFHGQIWRLVTFIIYPPSTSFVFILFALYLYFTIGTALEMRWGAFRFNMYIFTGMLFHILAGLIVYLTTGLTGMNFPITTTYLNMSLFLAFASMFPDVEFLLFFIIPFKAKWLGIVDAVLIGYEIFQYAQAGITSGNPAYFAFALCALLSVANFIIFFFANRNMTVGGFKQYQRRKQFQKSMAGGERRRTAANRAGSAASSDGNASGKAAAKAPVYSGNAFHKCCICGRTEDDGDELEFRYCSKCNGSYEYCQDHLFTHEHKQ